MAEINTHGKGSFRVNMIQFCFLDKLVNEEMAKYFQQHGLFNAHEFIKEKLVGCKNTKLQFAVTGDCGVGKSAFINALRG